MKKTRVLIADSGEEFRATLIRLLPQNYQVCQTGDGHEALALMISFSPDIVVMDVMLPGLDGISVLEKAAEHGCTSAVLATTRLLSGYLSQSLERLGVRYVMLKPCDAEAVVQRIGDIVCKPVASSDHEPNRAQQICDLLRMLSVPAKLKGYGYLREAVDIYARDPGQSITKELYLQVGKRCHVSVIQVERSVRTAIEAAWNRRDDGVWMRHFSVSAARPTNGAFIARLAECIGSHGSY